MFVFQLVNSPGVQETHFNATVMQTTNDGQLKHIDSASPRTSRENLVTHERSLSSSSRDRLSSSRDRLSTSSSRDRLSNASSRDRLSNASTSSMDKETNEAFSENTDTCVKEPYREPGLATSPGSRPRPILSSSDNFEELLDAEAQTAASASTEVKAEPKTKPPIQKRSLDRSPKGSPKTSPVSSQSSLERVSPQPARRLSTPATSAPPLSVFTELNQAKSLPSLDVESPLPTKPPRRPRTASRDE